MRHYIVLLLAFTWQQAFGQMKLIGQDYMKADPGNTLCMNHRLYQLFSKKPLQKDVNFLAVSWYEFQKGTMNKEAILKLSLDGGFAVIGSTEFEWVLPVLKSIGIDVLFVVHLSQSQAFKKINGITLVPFQHLSVNGVAPAEHKDILYSFVGAVCGTYCGARQSIFEMSHPADAVIIKREDFHFYQKDPAILAQEAQEYKDILARSRFSLCPRGYGRNTFRLWESLEAGAIPVIFSDEYALPDGFDWDSCIIRIAESDVASIPAVVAAVSPEQEAYMRAQCLKAYELFSGEHLADPIRRFYGEL